MNLVELIRMATRLTVIRLHVGLQLEETFLTGEFQATLEQR